MKQYGGSYKLTPAKSLKHRKEASPKERNCKQLYFLIDMPNLGHA